jgi:NADH dehydrogenase
VRSKSLFGSGLVGLGSAESASEALGRIEQALTSQQTALGELQQVRMAALKDWRRLREIDRDLERQRGEAGDAGALRTRLDQTLTQAEALRTKARTLSPAKRIAMLAREAGAETLVHISGIGGNAGSASPYIRSRGEGEAAVLDGFASAKLVRPAVMFGPGDAFLTPLLAMLRRLPIFPMFGSGATRLQPVYVEDVAEAVVRILRSPAASQLYELAGPRVYTYQELLRAIAASAGTRPFLVPFPFSWWHAVGYVAEALPSPPLTRNQVELMGQDNISEPGAPGFEALQISPQPIEIMLSG